MTHRASHDLAQHVAAPFVAGDDAIGDEERACAHVVGDDAHRRARSVGAHVRLAAHRRDILQQRLEQVGVVVALDALQHRGDAFEAHAGVDGRGGQRHQRATGLPVELHEDVVPDLHHGTVVFHEVDLGTPAARPGVAHLPEVVLGAEFADAIGRQELAPQVVGLVVARHARLAHEDGGVEAILRQLPDLGQQAPRVGDRLGLEVVAEREVAEHLEERVMPRRRADVVEVVVLAADAHALLRRRGARVVPLLLAEEDVLELVHPGVGEQQGRVVARNERGAGHRTVTGRFEEVEEPTADFTRTHSRSL